MTVMYCALGTGLVSAGTTTPINVGSPSKAFKTFVIICTPALSQSVGIGN